MKKYIAFYLIFFFLFSQFRISLEAQQTKTIVEKSQSNVELLCGACNDKILVELINKDSLTIEEKKLYAILQQNCEICKASEKQASWTREQIKAINTQSQIISDKPNASTPMWFVIITSIAASVVYFAISNAK